MLYGGDYKITEIILKKNWNLYLLFSIMHNIICDCEKIC